MAYVTSSRNTGTGFAARLQGAVANISESWNAYRVFRSTYTELSALSQRELDDLGIDRSMITRIAVEAAYGDDADTRG